MTGSNIGTYAPRQIRVLIADDHPVTREGLAALLTHQENLCVVAQARDGNEALELFRRHLPDVTLMDTRMPDMDGIQALNAIRNEFPQARVIMLSTFDASEDIYHAVCGGAKSYLLKDTEPSELLQTIVRVADGQTCLPAPITAKLTERMRTPNLTAREAEVLWSLTQGMSNQEIGSKLFIAEGTVKVHVANILSKLGVSDRTQAVTTALKRGLTRLPSK